MKVSNIVMIVAWIVVALCVFSALYFTHDPVCLWGFMALTMQGLFYIFEC